MLERVGIPDAARRIDGYPHEFSGGMRQRVMIAMALSLRPRAADRRRADDRARRHDPGADSRADPRPQARIGHERHPDHARPRRRRRHDRPHHRDVRRQGVRERPTAGAVRDARRIRTQKDSCNRVPDPRHRQRSDALPDSGPAARCRASAARLSRLRRVATAPKTVCRKEFPPLRRSSRPTHHSLCHFANGGLGGGSLRRAVRWYVDDYAASH